MSNQILNGRVSIITKSEIRYEGTLHQINPQLQNLTLKDVRSFGTEGRRPGNEIPPVSHTFDLIVFRAHEINELRMIQSENQQESEIEPVQQPPQYPSQPQSNIPVQQPSQVRPQDQEMSPSKIQKAPSSRTFDFDEMLEKITELEKLKQQQQPAQNAIPKYQKGNFFDQISSTITEKQLGPRNMTKEERQHQNEQDTETFGQFYKYNNNKGGSNNNTRRISNNNNNGNNGNRRRTYNTQYNNQDNRNQYNNQGYNNQNNRNYNNNQNSNQKKFEPKYEPKYEQKYDRVIYVEKKAERQEEKQI